MREDRSSGRPAESCPVSSSARLTDIESSDKERTKIARNEAGTSFWLVPTCFRRRWRKGIFSLCEALAVLRQRNFKKISGSSLLTGFSKLLLIILVIIIDKLYALP